MAEKVSPTRCTGSGRDVGTHQDPVMFLVPLEDASSPPVADTVDYATAIFSFFLETRQEWT